MRLKKESKPRKDDAYYSRTDQVSEGGQKYFEKWILALNTSAQVNASLDIPSSSYIACSSTEYFRYRSEAIFAFISFHRLSHGRRCRGEGISKAKPVTRQCSSDATADFTSPLNNEFAFDLTFKLPRIPCLAKQAAQQRSQHVDSFLIKIRCFIDFIFNLLRSFLLPVRAPATRKKHNQHHR